MSEQPNLLLCCFDLIPGPSGLSRRITEYLRGMSEKFQVVVLSAKTPDVSHIERYLGARLLRVPVGNGDLASRIQAFDRAVRRQMESEEFAIVHCFDPFGGYALCEMKSDYGYRFIYDASSFPSHELKWSHPDTENDRRFLARIRRQELYCLMNADSVITGSETTRKHIASLGVAVEQITVLRQPIDLSPYTQQAMGRPDASPMKLIYLGSQLGYQGLTTLLRAMQLALRHTDVRLTIVGPRHTEWQPPLEDLIEELKLKGKVEFMPPVSHDDVHKIVALGDAGALPLDPVERNTVQGGSLAKAAEYLAGGRPVIAADLEVSREIIPEGAGAFFPPGDYKALADVLVSLGTHPEQRVVMGEIGAKMAKERFDGVAARARLLEIYGGLQLVASREVDDRGEPTRSAVKALKAIAAEKKRNSSPDILKVVLDDGPPVHDTDDRATTAVTDPAASGKSEPPVVMGLPLREDATPSPATTVPNLQAVSDGPPPRFSPPSRPAPPLGAAPPVPSGSLPRPQIPSGSQSKGKNPLAPKVPSGSQPKAANPLGPIPTGSQARAKNPLGVPARPSSPQAPIPTGSQARASNPLASPARATGPQLAIPSGSQARAKSPLAVAAPAPSGSLPKPSVIVSDELLQPASDGKATDKRKALAALPVLDDEPEEVGDDALMPLTDTQDGEDDEPLEMAEAEEVNDDGSPASTLDPDDEPPEAEAESLEGDSHDMPQLASALDPWFAQLVHGWCPPDSGLFARLPPPTTMPGRENPPTPSRP